MPNQEHYIQPAEIFHDLSRSLKGLNDTTSRTEERVTHIAERLQDNDKRLSHLLENLSLLDHRLIKIEASRDVARMEVIIGEHSKTITLLERQMEIVQLHRKSSSENWKTVTGLVLQGLMTIGMAVVLWKLGLPSP